MDAPLRRRLELFRSMSTVPDAVVPLVEAELATLDETHRVDEETAGMLVSHLVAALARAVHGDTDVEPPAAEVYAQVVAEAPEAVAAAAAMADRLERELGTDIPAVERQYLAFHLATLAIVGARDGEHEGADKVAPQAAPAPAAQTQEQDPTTSEGGAP